MSGLDELFIKAKELANAAGNKAQELTELAKLRLQATQMKADIDANYLKLGEIIYELKKADAENEELVDMCIAEIADSLDDYEALNQRINEMRNVIQCSECMAANPVGALYCARCGTGLHQPESPEAEPTPAAETPAKDSDAPATEESVQLESAE